MSKNRGKGKKAISVSDTQGAVAPVVEGANVEAGEAIGDDTMRSEAIATAETPDYSESLQKQLFPEQFDNDEEGGTPANMGESAPSGIKTPPTEYLAVGESANKLVRVKIDGEERDIPLKDVIKGYQTDKYLSQKGHSVAEQDKLAAEKSREIELILNDINSGRQPNVPPATPSAKDEPPPIEDEMFAEAFDPQMKFLLGKIEKLENTNQVLAQAVSNLGPTQYDQDIKTLGRELNDQGYSDFDGYVKRIEAIVGSSQATKDKYYTMDGYRELYLRLKLKDAGGDNSLEQPQVIGETRPAPKIVKIEETSTIGSGSGLASQKTRANDAFNTAKKSGQRNDWAAAIAAAEL